MGGTEKDVLDIAMFAIIGATGLVTADDNNSRYIKASCRHHVRGWSLVAGGETDHAVQLRSFHGNLHIIDDQVPGRKYVTDGAGADDEIAGRDGADFKWQAASCCDRLFHHFGDAVEMAETDGKFRGTVDHGNLGFFHVRVADAQSQPLRPARGPAWCPRFKITAQDFFHCGFLGILWI